MKENFDDLFDKFFGDDAPTEIEPIKEVCEGEVKCLECGFSWNAFETEDFNFSFCPSCHNTTNFSGYFHGKRKRKK